MSQTPGFHVAEHDWHDGEYVDQWIARDNTRPERPPKLHDMVAIATFPRDQAIRVLDVGGGNGLVTEVVLDVFPKARVTVQDFSQPMLDRAAVRFKKLGDQISYSLSDLFDAGWAAKSGGPFDVIVSSIAIHNLGNWEEIAAVYKAAYGLLVPGGYFLNCDHYRNVGGHEKHAEELRKIGFSNVTIPSEENPAIIAGQK